MEDITISFSEKSKGWVSFKTFVPEVALSLNNEYYSIKDGVMWRHHSNSVDRNSFYNTNGEINSTSSITVLFNDSPSIIKSFTTLNYEGSQSRIIENLTGEVYNGITSTDSQHYNNQATLGWHVDLITTDQQTGTITEFINKEGKWFNYIIGEETQWRNGDILENNNFNTGLDGWAVDSDNPPNNSTNPNAAPYVWNSGGFIDADAGLYKKIYQSSTDILTGYTYRVSYDLTVVQGSVGIILVADDGTATGAVYKGGATRTTSGSYTEDLTVSSTTTNSWAINMWSANKNFAFDSKDPANNFVGTIDNVTCYDINNALTLLIGDSDNNLDTKEFSTQGIGMITSNNTPVIT